MICVVVLARSTWARRGEARSTWARAGRGEQKVGASSSGVKKMGAGPAPGRRRASAWMPGRRGRAPGREEEDLTRFQIEGKIVYFSICRLCLKTLPDLIKLYRGSTLRKMY